jgi:hypothetical protein
MMSEWSLLQLRIVGRPSAGMVLSSVKNAQAVDLESQSDVLWKSNLPESRRSKGDSLQI